MIPKHADRARQGRNQLGGVATFMWTYPTSGSIVHMFVCDVSRSQITLLLAAWDPQLSTRGCALGARSVVRGTFKREPRT